jgi:hypothetical protein
MSHTNHCNARKGVSVGRTSGQHSLRSGNKNDGANPSRLGQDATKTKRLTFVEDFMLEHSHSGLLIAMIKNAGSYGAACKDQQKPTQSFGFPS